MAHLLGKDSKRIGDAAVGVAALMPGASPVGEVRVAQNCKESSAEVGTFLEAPKVPPCLQERLLDQVVGQFWIAAQGERKRAQTGNVIEKRLLQ